MFSTSVHFNDGNIEDYNKQNKYENLTIKAGVHVIDWLWNHYTHLDIFTMQYTETTANVDLFILTLLDDVLYQSCVCSEDADKVVGEILQR